MKLFSQFLVTAITGYSNLQKEEETSSLVPTVSGEFLFSIVLPFASFHLQSILAKHQMKTKQMLQSCCDICTEINNNNSSSNSRLGLSSEALKEMAVFLSKAQQNPVGTLTRLPTSNLIEKNKKIEENISSLRSHSSSSLPSLSLISQWILLSSYIASFVHKQDDLRLFSVVNVGRKKTKIKKTKQGGQKRNEGKLSEQFKAPSSFELERMIAIYKAISGQIHIELGFELLSQVKKKKRKKKSLKIIKYKIQPILDHNFSQRRVYQASYWRNWELKRSEIQIQRFL
jgi:hypothetical protein